MENSTFIKVTQFIDDNILYSSVWDEADGTVRIKAVNNSINLLLKMLPVRFKFTIEADLPIDIIANQSVWMLKIDDTVQRAELGITYIQMSGVAVNIHEKDLSIAPYVMKALNISPDPVTGGITVRKVCGYSGRTIGTPYSRYRKEQ